MRNIALASLVAFGLMPSVVLANELPASVKAAAATLVNMGYSDVAVSLRVFGGYVLQGKLGGAFATIALSTDGKTIISTALFRDLDGNGVFGQDEALGQRETQPLATMIRTALSDPASVAGQQAAGAVQENGAADLDIPGFVQTSQNLITSSSLQVKAREQLGVGTPVLMETQTVIAVDSDREQDHGLHVTQVSTTSGLQVRDRNTVVSQPGGGQVTFSQPDVAAIRASVASGTPNADALRAALQSNAPTAESIRAGIAPPP